MSRVPRIRFKGFEEDWEQRKLGEVANRFDSIRIPISENLRVLGNTPYYGANGIQDYVDGYTHDGEYVLIAEDGANDLKNYPIRLVKGRIWVNNHAHVIQGIEKFMNNQFINFAMSQVDFESIVVGCGRAKLNAEQLMDICFKIPNKNEQSNIGRLFESLDHLITLHQRKLEKLKIIKKSMLENLFPQNGEKTSKIRFSGFTKDWEQRKLGEVCNIITKQTGFDYSSTIKPALLKEKADNTYPFIQNKDFNGTTINMDTDFFIPISIAEKFPNILLDRPSLLISISGRIGNVGFYSCVHKAFIGGAVGICKLKYDDDGKFIIHELESEYGQKYFRLLIKASSHANITVEDIRNIELIFPNQKEEKVCISTFFSSLDHLITLHQRKLDKLQKIKKSMRECMFI